MYIIAFFRACLMVMIVCFSLNVYGQQEEIQALNDSIEILKAQLTTVWNDTTLSEEEREYRYGMVLYSISMLRLKRSRLEPKGNGPKKLSKRALTKERVKQWKEMLHKYDSLILSIEDSLKTVAFCEGCGGLNSIEAVKALSNSRNEETLAFLFENIEYEIPYASPEPNAEEEYYHYRIAYELASNKENSWRYLPHIMETLKRKPYASMPIHFMYHMIYRGMFRAFKGNRIPDKFIEFLLEISDNEIQQENLRAIKNSW